MKILLLIFTSFQLFSQNLVVNPSFEKTKMCVENFGRFNEETFFWTTPNLGTTDLYNACNQGVVGIPKNYHGIQEAFEGKNYIGCYFLAPDNYREYIQGKLTKQLIKDEKYKISFNINLSDDSVYAISNIDFLLSQKKIHLIDVKEIDFNEIDNNEFTMYHIDNDIFYEDKENWELISKTFTAKGNEKYLTIGNFKKNSKTPKHKLKKKKDFYMSYYYIDLVSIIKINSDVDRVKNVVKDIKSKQVESIIIDKKYVFNKVKFKFDSIELSNEAKNEIDEVFNYLMSNTNTIIKIMGHTDNIGSDDFNKVLSKKRAETVMNYLLEKGIQKYRIKSIGFGVSKPLKSNDSEKGRSENRRVEFIITKQTP